MPAPSTGLNLTGLFKLGVSSDSGDPENNSDPVRVLPLNINLIR